MTISGTFNTGRGYTPEGQIISYEATLVKVEGDDFFTGYDATIKFDDDSRMISGDIECYFVNKPSVKEVEAELLYMYDQGKYTL